MEIKDKTIYQSNRLYVKMNGKYRWVLTPEVFEKMKLDWDWKKRKFLGEQEIHKNEGSVITEWPEKNPNYKVGKERLFFCVPPEADFQRIKNVGATLIQSYGMVWQHNQGAGFLNKAEEHGLKVLYSIKALIHDKLEAGQGWERAECQRLVAEFNGHPALWGWYLLDEPDGGLDDPNHAVSLELQKEIVNAFRSWTDKPLTISVLAAAKGYHLVDFSLYDLIIPDAYVFDGSGKCWDKEPLEYLDFATKQISDYFDEHNITTPMMFMFQCDDSVPAGNGYPNTKIPLGEIENQFNTIKPYNLFNSGVAMYAWDGVDFCPNRNDEIYNEIKDLFDKIKED